MSAPNSERVLILRRRYLGDVVLLGALIRNLRLHWPGAHIAVAVERPYAEILGLNRDVDETLLLPAGVLQWPGFVRRVRSARFTHLIDLDNTEGTAVLTRLSAAPTRVVLHHGTLPVKLPRAYTHPVHDPAERHETHTISEYYLRALEPLGVPIATHEITLKPRDSDLVELRRFVGASARVLLVHPGSRSAMRVWPADRFARVIDHVQDELDVQVVLTGGPSDQPIVDAIRQQVRTHLLALPAPTTIGRFAAVARLSHAVLCHDSGPMHVAAAVGTPVIALYGSQNAALFRPTGPRHTVLQPHLPCVTCVTPGECDPTDSYRNRCVQNITVERVIEAARATLAAPGSAATSSRP